jgi:CheY-like chemotaxis protein
MEALALALSTQTPYRVVILDEQMPGMGGLEVVEHMRATPGLQDTPVILLNSADLSSTAERSRVLRVTKYLVKPVQPVELQVAVATALATASPAHVNERRLPTVQGQRDSLEILVAEDNVINQKLAVALLSKMGHRVRTATNGIEAVKALGEEQYDLVFMDVQMPELDGFGATKKIRELEAATGAHVSIIAMTAHAMAGDRERCVAAGMDDYLSKPISYKAVEQVLKRLRN